MACAEVVSDPLLVAAIDFGTTFSGYAFQTKSDFKEDPVRIQGFTWTTGSNAGLSNKTPTCILFNPSESRLKTNTHSWQKRMTIETGITSADSKCNCIDVK
jgi:hypothetical protein